MLTFADPDPLGEPVISRYRDSRVSLIAVGGEKIHVVDVTVGQECQELRVVNGELVEGLGG